MGNFKEQKVKPGDEALNAQFPDYEVVTHYIGNQTNAVENNNKYFSIELHRCTNGKWRVYTNYGRVEDKDYSGVVGIYGPSSEQEMRDFFEDKWKEKSKKYKKIDFIKAKVGSPKAREIVYGVSADEIPDDKKKKLNESVKKTSTKPSINLDPLTKKLVEQWYRENGNAITSNSAVKITSEGMMTPLGVLTFGTVSSGRKILGEITDAIKAKDTNEIKKLTGAFYSMIPTKLGRKITDSDLISDDAIVQQKLDLLDMMDSALEVGGGQTFTSETETKFLELGITADVLAKSDPEFKRLDEKIQKSRASNHHGVPSKVRNILKITLNADSKRYSTCNVGNEQELWHGSRNCNILGILKKGLLIAPPEAPVSGYMFDKGIYMASASTKSLNYSLYSFPNMDNPDNCFMFVVKGKLGKQLKLQDSDYNAKSRCHKEGCDSTWGVKGRALYNDEFIVYTLGQVQITHIVEIAR